MDTTTPRLMSCKLHYINQDSPPPYKYQFDADIDLITGKCHINQTYLERESCTQEELDEAGFTDQDDFKWQGHLHANWLSYLKKIYARHQHDLQAFGHIEYTLEGQNQSRKFLNNLEMEMLIQSLIQAVLEQNKVESPLIMKIYRPDNRLTYTLQMSFANLSASYHTDLTGESKSIDWDAAMQFVQKFYLCDFDEYASTAHKPMAEKWCIALEPDVWMYVDEATARRKNIPDLAQMLSHIID